VPRGVLLYEDFVGLVFSSVCLRVGPQVLRLVGVRTGGFSSCLLFLRANGLLKNALFFATDVSSMGVIGLGSAKEDCGIGFPGDAEPLGGPMLSKEVGLE